VESDHYETCLIGDWVNDSLYFGVSS